MAFQFYCPNGHLLEGHESQMGQQSQCPMCGVVFMIPVVQTGQAAPGGWPPGYAPPPGYGQPAYGQPGYGQPPAGVGYPGHAPGYPGMAAPGQQPGWASPYAQPPAEGGFPGVAAGNEFPGINTGAGAFPGAPQDSAAEEASPPGPSGAAAETPPAEEEKPAEPEKKEPRIVRIPCPQGHELQTPMDMVNQDVLCPICNTQFHLRYEDSIEFKEEQAELRRLKAEQLNQAALKWSIIAAVVVVLGILGMILYLAFRSPPEPTYAAPEEPPAVENDQAEANAPEASKNASAKAESDAEAKRAAADAGEEEKP